MKKILMIVGVIIVTFNLQGCGPLGGAVIGEFIENKISKEKDITPGNYQQRERQEQIYR